MFFGGRYRQCFLTLISCKPCKVDIVYKNLLVGMNDSEDFAVLTERLTKAEKRLKILILEINDIKSKITSIQQANPYTSTLRQFCTTSRPRAFDDENAASDVGPSQKRLRVDFDTKDGYVNVFTDGACEKNGQVGAKAGIGVWFGDNHVLNVSEPVVGKATNNTAEIQACVQATTIARENGVEKLRIMTDSQFIISAMTNWIKKWKKNNWKIATGGAVKNKEDFIKLDQGCQKLKDVQWVHVNGHCGIRGNEEADKLAREGALRYRSN